MVLSSDCYICNHTAANIIENILFFEIQKCNVLKSAVNRYRTIIDNSTCGLMILSDQGKILEINRQGQKILRVDEKVTGTTIFDLFIDENGYSFSDAFESVLNQSAAFIRNEFKLKTSDGSIIWLDVSIQNQLNEPDVNAMIINFHDITGFKENEEKLRHEKERYDILAKATSDTIWDWDIVNDKMQYNSGITEMFGYNQAEIENTENWWQKKIHPDDLNKVVNMVNKVLRSHNNQMQFRYRFLCQDGTYKYIFDRAFLIFDDNGKPVRMIGAMQDVTKIRDYILSIKRQNQKLRKISWTQSHVVRAPLTRIMGLINLLKDNPSEEILKHISTAAKELDRVIRDVVKETQ